MPVTKNAFPILEYDTHPQGVIMPNRAASFTLPQKCLLTFFSETLASFTAQNPATVAGTFQSEMGHFPVYVCNYRGVEFALAQALVGSASIATLTDYLIGHGVKQIIACGSCGVLCDIPAGDVLVPVCALRDEGASYHYLPPTRDIELDEGVVASITATLQSLHTPYVLCKTWTTDAFYRETPDMITYRKEEGCQVVEMECATMASVAKFRGAQFGQLLYSGDLLTDYSNYQERDWFINTTAREKLFYLSLESLIQLP